MLGGRPSRRASGNGAVADVERIGINLRLEGDLAAMAVSVDLHASCPAIVMMHRWNRPKPPSAPMWPMPIIVRSSPAGAVRCPGRCSIRLKAKPFAFGAAGVRRAQRADRSESVAKLGYRSAGQTQDIADGVLFLASDVSNYMTGAELLIGGGMTRRLCSSDGGSWCVAVCLVQQVGAPARCPP